MRRFSAFVAAAAFALATMTPAAAEARDGRWRDRHDGYYDYYDHGRYDRRHDRGYRHHDRDDDNDDAIAAGVVGLVLGLALGAAASQPRRQPDRSYAPPPPRYYDDYRSGYYGSAYDYDYRAPQRTCRVRQWDRYAQRHVMVDVPC